MLKIGREYNAEKEGTMVFESFNKFVKENKDLFIFENDFGIESLCDILGNSENTYNDTLGEDEIDLDEMILDCNVNGFNSEEAEDILEMIKEDNGNELYNALIISYPINDLVGTVNTFALINYDMNKIYGYGLSYGTESKIYLIISSDNE